MLLFLIVAILFVEVLNVQLKVHQLLIEVEY